MVSLVPWFGYQEKRLLWDNYVLDGTHSGKVSRIVRYLLGNHFEIGTAESLDFPAASILSLGFAFDWTRPTASSATREPLPSHFLVRRIPHGFGRILFHNGFDEVQGFVNTFIPFC